MYNDVGMVTRIIHQYSISLKNDLAEIRFPLSIYILWYGITLFYQIFLQPINLLTESSASLDQRIFWAWVNSWDSAHYISIAQHGYVYPQQAFFPLWPILIKYFSTFTQSLPLASYILTTFFSITTFILFYKLAVKVIGVNQAKRALVLFAVFPSTMFLRSGYTEGLFLSLVLTSFLFFENKKYLYAAIFAGLTTATRFVGIASAIMFFLIKKDLSKRMMLFGVSLSGAITYIIFLQFKFGDWLLFNEVQQEWCVTQGRCGLEIPLLQSIDYGKNLLLGTIRPNLGFEFIDWLSTIVFFLMLIPVFKKLNKHYFVYSIMVLILPLFSGTIGMVRYVLVAFPIFMIAPFFLKNKAILFVVCVWLFLLQLRFIALFTNLSWVA